MTESPLLTVTSAALKKIDAVRKSAGNPKGHLRIGIKGRRGATFEYEFVLVGPVGQQPDDVAIDYPGLRVLVDPKSVELLRGATVDVDPTGESIDIANPNEGCKDALAQRAQQVLVSEINPGVQMHGGLVTLLEVKDGAAYIEMGGGCQGCGMKDVTLRQGIEGAFKRRVPEITQIIDTTDHAAGTNPYYQPSKK